MANTKVFYEKIFFSPSQLDNNLNPDWQTKFTIDYHFEARQMLKFEVYDWDRRSDKLTKKDYLGKAKCSLGMVVASPAKTFVVPMKGPSEHGGQVSLNFETTV